MTDAVLDVLAQERRVRSFDQVMTQLLQESSITLVWEKWPLHNEATVKKGGDLHKMVTKNLGHPPELEMDEHWEVAHKKITSRCNGRRQQSQNRMLKQLAGTWERVEHETRVKRKNQD